MYGTGTGGFLSFFVMYGTVTGECTLCTVFFSEMYGIVRFFLLDVYGTMYGICVKPPWPPCLYPFLLLLYLCRDWNFFNISFIFNSWEGKLILKIGKKSKLDRILNALYCMQVLQEIEYFSFLQDETFLPLLPRIKLNWSHNYISKDTLY